MATIDVVKTGNTIEISSTYIQALGSVNRLGAAQTEFTSPNIEFKENIFFKFYSCDDSTGTKVYSAIDITAVSNLSIERFLTMVFLNYYADTTVVNFLSTEGDSFTPLSQRLADVALPDTALSSTLTMPASTSNFVEFIGMGMGSFFGAKYVNDGAEDFFSPGSVWGTRVGQVHITATDPLGPSPIEALYDNSDTGCWKFSDYNCNGVIVYTNVAAGAFNPSNGLGHWGQMLCVWPIVSELLNAQFACMFNTLDQSFMKSGLGYFDRSARRDTYFGWAGNYIQSIFNDWGIPVISPLWALSECSIVTCMTKVLNLNTGDIAASSIPYRFIGPRAFNNTSNVVEKCIRSVLPLLWANECTYSTVSADSAYPSFESAVQALGYADGAAFTAACTSAVSLGYNAHMYKYIMDNNLSGQTPTNTRNCITNGVSWASTLSTQPSLTGVFESFGDRMKYFPEALTNFYSGGYLTALQNRIEQGISLSNFPMDSVDIIKLKAWVYTP